jgi:hypothetical protein
MLLFLRAIKEEYTEGAKCLEEAESITEAREILA